MPPAKKRSKRASTPQSGSLPIETLRWRCDMEDLPFDSTNDVSPVTGVVGQDTAVEALRFGLETSAPGQNVFVRGPSGTGRLTLVRKLLKEIRPEHGKTKDCCYVHNFSRPERPRLIIQPPGRGQAFRRRVDRLADFVRRNLVTVLSSESVSARRSALDRATEKRLKGIMKPFEEALNEAGLALVSFQAGPVTQTAVFPLVDDKPVPPEEFDDLHEQGDVSDEQHAAIHESYEKFEDQLKEISKRVGEIRQQHDRSAGELLERTARSTLEEIARDIEKEFPQDGVRAFLRGLMTDVVERRLSNLSDNETDFTQLYRVNVVVKRDDAESCPIIVENTPTLRNLLGSVDPTLDADGEARPAHLGIRAGSLLRADGGYLILEDQEILRDESAWKALMRTLRTNRLEIAPPDLSFPGGGLVLKAEPIEVNVKVVILGGVDTYSLLDAHDPDFPQLFKVLSDFDSVIPRDHAGVRHYAAVLAHIVKEEGLLPLNQAAVAALTEYGARIAARKGKLTARFGRLADIAREASYIAGKEQRQPITGDDIREAVRRTRRRADLPSRRFRELLTDGTIRVETGGVVVGQINGLAVLQSGPLTYGFPTRMTATMGPGNQGVINIEREAELSGAIHTKGFYILRGLLRFLLKADHPLAFAASIAFEQSYGGIDGDSASGAEICCLLSALTKIPIRQDMAMTGAIDQMGHILAVGAVNEKVEGFFDVCNDLGLTGTQGVVIPQANSGDLMLREDVLEACENGMFNVYAVETVHEAIELLTGKPAGVRNARGAYPRGSVLGVAVRRAREYWSKASYPSSTSSRKTRK